MTIEAFQPLWFTGFFVDVILGCMAFYLVQADMMPERFKGLGWWMGWWSFVGAISLVLNAYMGTDYFFSYHQIGIISDMAVNAALIAFLFMFMMDNWGMTEDDWQKIHQIKQAAKIRKLQK